LPPKRRIRCINFAPDAATFCCLERYPPVKLKPNTHRRRDATVELRRVGVGGVNTIRN